MISTNSILMSVILAIGFMIVFSLFMTLISSLTNILYRICIIDYRRYQLSYTFKKKGQFCIKVRSFKTSELRDQYIDFLIRKCESEKNKLIDIIETNYYETEEE